MIDPEGGGCKFSSRCFERGEERMHISDRLLAQPSSDRKAEAVCFLQICFAAVAIELRLMQYKLACVLLWLPTNCLWLSTARLNGLDTEQEDMTAHLAIFIFHHCDNNDPGLEGRDSQPRTALPGLVHVGLTA
ncbi:MAG: hypothetical protein FRX49_01470 [Trebouxia sp. A1-2]|nr:MAG: hypothetical protein FRX49_01470 [Trebouxia sp. A1-2]